MQLIRTVTPAGKEKNCPIADEKATCEVTKGIIKVTTNHAITLATGNVLEIHLSADELKQLKAG